MPFSTLALLATALDAISEDLVGGQPKPGERGSAPMLQQQLEQLRALARAKPRLVSEVLDSLLAQAGG